MALSSNGHEKRITRLENGTRTILKHIETQQEIMRAQQERSDRKFAALLERIDRQQAQLDKHQQKLDFVIRWMKRKMEGES